jgi:hypothetical protein
VASYDDLKELKTQLIRKTLGGSVFVAEYDVEPIDTLTELVGTAPDQTVELAALPTGYGDLGYLTDDGAQFSTETTTSDVTSWQSTSPTRSDITSETSTMTVTAQETKLLTMGLYLGVATAGIQGAVGTGEVLIKKPQRPSARFYRVLGLAVDGDPGQEIYIARFLPRAKITGRGEQAYSKSDQALTWPVTFTGFHDEAYGTAEAHFFGGPGWLALLDSMGIEQAT